MMTVKKIFRICNTTHGKTLGHVWKHLTPEQNTLCYSCEFNLNDGLNTFNLECVILTDLLIALGDMYRNQDTTLVWLEDDGKTVKETKVFTAINS